jgi:hypothetical protein
VKLTTHFQLGPRLRKNGDISPLPIYRNGINKGNFTFLVNNKLESMRKEMVVASFGDVALTVPEGTEQALISSGRIFSVWREI